MKAVVAAFNQEKALVGAFSVITNLRMELFEALEDTLRMRCYKPGLLCYRKSIFSAPTVAIIPCLLRTDSEIYLYLGNNLLQSEAVCRL